MHSSRFNRKSIFQQRSGFRALLLLALFFTLVVPAGSAKAYPPVYVEKIGTPDLYQADRRARLPGRGKGYCAPVAVSNSLVWLAFQGYPDLLPDMGGGKRMTQVQMAATLGMKKFMDTSIIRGTGPAEIMRGTRKYLDEQGYEPELLAYQGWRIHQKEFSTGIKRPQLNWIKQNLQGDAGVWLNLGWYTVDESRTYTRTGGHWVTLVGYGMDRIGNKNSSYLIVHDPATRLRPKRQVLDESKEVAVRPQAEDLTRAQGCDVEESPEQKEIQNKGRKGESPENKATASPGKKAAKKSSGVRLRHDFVELVPLKSGRMIGVKPDLNLPAKGFYQVKGIRSIPKKADLCILDGVVVLRLKPGQKAAAQAQPKPAEEDLAPQAAP